MITLVDLYNGLLKYNNKDIVIVIDELMNIWFYAKQIAKILEYANTAITINQQVSNINKTTYEQLKNYSKYEYKIQDHAIFINETGLHELIIKSKMKKAIKFKEWILGDVIPELRKKGEYIMNKKDKEEIKTLNKEIYAYKKRIMILENNQSKPRFPKGGYVYALQPPEYLDSDLFKPGKSEKMTDRYNTYNTSYPDKMFLIHKIKVDDPVGVEFCIKAFLNKYVYRTKKEYYKVDKKILIDIMNKCAGAIENNNINKLSEISEDENVSRISKSKKYNKDLKESNLIYIYSVTKEESYNQKAGFNEFFNKYLEYKYLKNKYIELKKKLQSV
jgi:prophage antirepressor-like protein